MKTYITVTSGARWYDRNYTGGPHLIEDPEVLKQIKADLKEGCENIELIETEEDLEPDNSEPQAAEGPLTTEDLTQGTEAARTEPEPVEEPPVPTKEPAEPVEFPCDDCDKVYRSEAALKGHITKHHPPAEEPAPEEPPVGADN